jgi:hypothetical protein
MKYKPIKIWYEPFSIRWHREPRWPRAGWRNRREDGFYSFMSYSTRDDEVKIIKPFVDHYVHELRRYVAYIPIFYDGFYIPHGHQDLRRYLAQAIYDSDFTTAFVSPGYVSSAWCLFEWWESERLSDAPPEDDKTLTHGLLPFVWKDLNGSRNGEVLLRSRAYVNIADQVAGERWGEALEIAVRETLRFLDFFYGEARNDEGEATP